MCNMYEKSLLPEIHKTLLENQKGKCERFNRKLGKEYVKDIHKRVNVNSNIHTQCSQPCKLVGKHN